MAIVRAFIPLFRLKLEAELSRRLKTLLHERIDHARRLGRDQDGMTLLEVLIALAIFSLLMSTVFAFFSQGIERIALADRLGNAEALTQSLAAKIGTEIPLRSGEISGQDDARLRWRVLIRPFNDSGDRHDWPVGAYAIRIEVRRDDRADPLTELTTIRLGPAENTR